MKATLAPLLSLILGAATLSAESIPAIPRKVPPPGIEIPAETRAKLEARLQKANARPATIRDNPDVAVFSKAVRFALENGEFYINFHTPFWIEKGRRISNGFSK